MYEFFWFGLKANFDRFYTLFLKIYNFHNVTMHPKIASFLAEQPLRECPLSPYQTRDWDWDWIGFWPIKAKFTKSEIGFLSSDWLNSNPISISISSLIRALAHSGRHGALRPQNIFCRSEIQQSYEGTRKIPNTADRHLARRNPRSVITAPRGDHRHNKKGKIPDSVFTL